MTPALHVETVGAGPPLVLLHGWAMHSGLWGAQVERLATRFRVHAIDLPGHGHSEPISPYTLDALVDALDAALPAKEAPLSLMGWSLGGMVALRWAQRHPHRIARLVLIATTPSFVTRDDWPHAIEPQALARFGDELRVAYRLTLMRFLSLQLAGTVDGKGALATMRRHLFERGDPSPAILDAGLSLLAQTDLRDDVTAIRLPALVIAGDRDTLTPLAASAWLAAALADARFVAIPGGGHVPFLSHPAAFAAALTGFVDER